MDDAVELADVISQIRRDLSQAMWSGERSDVRFEAETVELTLTIGVERNTKPGGKVKLVVFEAGADLERKKINTQQVRLVMRPVKADGSGAALLIEGADEDDET
ncbi:trypco2 family protein [Actinoplanes sp. CA-054009]